MTSKSLVKKYRVIGLFIKINIQNNFLKEKVDMKFNKKSTNVYMKNNIIV